MEKKWSTQFLILFFFIGLIVLLYPSVSSYTNKKAQSKAITKYEEVLSNTIDYDKYFDEARDYNNKLSKLSYPLISYKKLGNTDNILTIDGTKIIGYIYIDKIRVELPIYYGTSESVLASSAGLLEGSSFPIGEIGTHSVISAHRGLPSSRLFTDLDTIEIGDTFVVKVLNKTMTYEVDQILIVKPDDLKSLKIDPDLDQVTLMTCTPYGINSHRLLIRGHRVENAVAKLYVSTDAFKVDRLIVTPIACMPILLIWIISIAFKPVTNYKKLLDKYVYPNGKMDI